MKKKTRFIAFVVSLIIIGNFFITSSISVYAHDFLLNVGYDTCTAVVDGDGVDEVWYVLEKSDECVHINNEIDTIKYRFCDNPESGESWIRDNGFETDEEEIKLAYAESMKKWNNVYFYSYNSNGTITKERLIEVVEATGDDYNLTIVPNTELGEIGDIIATTDTEGGGVNIDDETVNHSHYPKWIMEVNINCFFNSPYGLSSEEVNWARETVGAHELGHVLGLRDVDNLCGSSSGQFHHEEVLMGYGEGMEERTSNITYKDIAGVAITRGFHTDNDHKWLNMGQQSDGKYKLVCSICNGVRHVTTEELIEYSYHTYGACNNEHDLPDGNMMAVASYGDQDYYKCKYCRYVAPFSEIVEQDYEKTSFSDTHHKCENTVDGLEYTFYEEHTFVNYVCTGCGYVCPHTHMYGSYVYHNNTLHRRTCICGHAETQAHYIYASDIVDGRYVTCLGCGELLDLQYDTANSIMSNITQVSVNGSYIRSDGIVVLVDEDIEAYLAGTLQFYHPEDVPVTQ